MSVFSIYICRHWQVSLCPQLACQSVRLWLMINHTRVREKFVPRSLLTSHHCVGALDCHHLLSDRQTGVMDTMCMEHLIDIRSGLQDGPTISITYQWAVKPPHNDESVVFFDFSRRSSCTGFWKFCQVVVVELIRLNEHVYISFCVFVRNMASQTTFSIIKIVQLKETFCFIN